MYYSKLSNIVNDINTILLPHLCFGCNVRLYRGEKQLCTVCRNQLPLTEFNFNEENAVDRIFYGRTVIKKAAAFLYYTEKGIVQNLIHYLKYRNQQDIGIFLGDWFGSQLKSQKSLENIHFVIPVPLHKRKLRKRGYNQLTNFGKRLAYYLQAEYRENILIKTADTKTQTKKNRWYRSENITELFQITNPQLLEGKNILLVDDVITTGGTMEACCNALLKARGISIYIAAMAVVP